MSRIVKWKPDDGEEVLWVCPTCDAHLHADCVGDACPTCGESVADDEQDGRTP